jgi:hypothetical protein
MQCICAGKMRFVCCVCFPLILMISFVFFIFIHNFHLHIYQRPVMSQSSIRVTRPAGKLSSARSRKRNPPPSSISAAFTPPKSCTTKNPNSEKLASFMQ